MRTIRENGFLGAMLLAGCMLLFCGSAITAASKKAKTEAAVEAVETAAEITEEETKEVKTDSYETTSFRADTESKASESSSSSYSYGSSYSCGKSDSYSTKSSYSGISYDDEEETNPVLNDSYDEGYDSVYEDDDYDLDRYDRDQDYADGVEDAISDYEDEFGEEW